jgi:hypothetical protein
MPALSLLSAIAGLVFGLAALVLLAKQRFVKGDEGSVEVELPLFGRIKSNYPALIVVFIGAFLIFYPQYRGGGLPAVCPPPPPPPPVAQVTIKGTLHRSDQESHAGIMVGVIPGSNLTATDSDGTFTMSVNRVAGAYTAVAFVPESSFAPVCKNLTFTDDVATFDYAFAPRGGPHIAEGPPPQ